ncbi:transcriptional regulator LytR [Marinithermofilum abyssi]|uniref:Transcriptional regulator LytR n=1 Tax=Marinithermofilum abyssi TaxID=1571185 RepID=A0A8J2YA25_9BACL|nr:LCP family protein [Marinithermofilum abyssi]GGE04897.1 transcriptional regulator LytR [Marinithermofilum abyssi]
MNRWKRVAGIFLIGLLAATTGWWVIAAPHSTNNQPSHGNNKASNPTPIFRKSSLPSPYQTPFSLLLIGVDKRKEDTGRSDALMLLVIRPDDHHVTILNIPRDTKTRLHLGDGRVRLDKINHAYALGDGVNATVRTVEDFLQIPVHYYVKVDMKGFRSIIDLFDGVNVDVDHAFSYKGQHFHKGQMHMNGAQALAYVRDRTGTTDFERHRRQQQVMQSLWHQAKDWSTLFKMGDLLHIVMDHVQTSMKVTELWKLVATIRQVPPERVETLHLNGTDQWNPHYYFLVTEKERLRVSRVLRRQLEL